MTNFEQTVVMHPAYDKRTDDPKTNCGIGGCKFVFILKGPKGAIQFMIGTDWHLPRVQRENRKWQYDYDDRFDKIKPDGWDVGFHGHKPLHEGQEVSHEDCYILGGPCYYDGSGLWADELIPDFLAGGTEWLWPKLKEIYEEQFNAD